MNNIIVYGSPGTGKTHSVKSILENIQREINGFYERAYRATSVHSFFRRFLETNFKLSLHPRESILEYYKAFEKSISKMKTILLVFDDIQYLLSEDPKGLDGLLFYLSRLGKNLGLILIGNIRPNDLSSALDSPTHSSLKLRAVHFPRYNAPELENILMDRARFALTEKAFKRSKGAVKKIAGVTAQGWGSARYALDLFKEAGIASERILNLDYITEEAVDKAREMIEVNSIEDQIRTLPPHPLALLEAIYLLREEKKLSTGNVYSTYTKVCRQIGIEPFSQRKVSDMITDLDSEGLISCQQVFRGRRGRTRFISWHSNPIMDEIYEKERVEKFS
jgi:cell division control protein 6